MGRIIESACDWAINIALDNNHGYDQINRQGPDYDCSSLVINAYEQAGLKIKEAGATYTGNMKNAFVKCGFKALAYRKGIELKRGDILLNEKHHTLLYLGNKKMIQASNNERDGIYGGKPGDQTGREIYIGNFYEYSKGWDYILRYEEDREDQKVNVELTFLKLGSNCPEVGTVQTLLNSLGFVGKNGKPLTVDCDFGTNTEYAVKNFQRSNNIGDDGMVGTKTYPALLKANYYR